MELPPLVNAIPMLIMSCIIIGFYIKYKYPINEQNPSKRSKTHRICLQDRTKYPEVNVFKHRPIFFKLGLIGALSVTLMAFSWTSYDKKEIFFDLGDMELIDVEIEPPRTKDLPKEPPPPPPPAIEEVVEEIPEDQPVFLDMSIDADETIEPVILKPTPEEIILPPPPPPPVEEDIEEIISFAEEMPRFPGCDTGSKEDKKKCSDKKLLQYLAKNLKYPTIAKENGIQGKMFVQFVVNTDGTIQDAVALKDIGGGCGKAALQVVNDMNNLEARWIPGKQRGRPVRVKYTLPFTFKLN